jgi:hypothetical protein
MAPLFRRRRQLRELAEREAAGESFWTEHFEAAVRTKLGFAAGEAAIDIEAVFVRARFLILRDEGGNFLIHEKYPPATDMQEYLLGADDEAVPTAIEAIYLAMVHLSGNTYGPITQRAAYDFTERVNEVLAEHRIAFEFRAGEMIPFSSKELQVTILNPALHLLNDRRFDKAEKAYQDALGEIASGKAGDAITDAATALQELLVALGCKGNSLGPLLRSAKADGLLSSHDDALAKVLEAAIDWVSADRSNTGDSHRADDARKPDAWLTVHIVGAIMVRLVEGSRAK